MPNTVSTPSDSTTETTAHVPAARGAATSWVQINPEIADDKLVRTFTV
jgi:hypothetical protein